MKPITVKTTIQHPLSKVWGCWTQPSHIIHWNFASEDWHCPAATQDLKVGGTFSYTMASKDGSMSFDFKGTYTKVEVEKCIAYTMEDGRVATILFTIENGATQIVETFDPESENSIELQQAGWQAILDNFKAYMESI